jgi:predicted amidohydrolase YtcJ
VRTATHAIGDAAVRHVLDTVAAPGRAVGTGTASSTFETAPDDLLLRFAQAGVIVSMQPPHTAHTRPDGTGEWSPRLGTVRAAHAWRLRDLRDAGATLALGFDWPIAHDDVRAVLAAGRSPNGAASRRSGLTGLEALEGCTTHAARAAGSRTSGAGSPSASGPTSRPAPWTRSRPPRTNWPTHRSA